MQVDNLSKRFGGVVASEAITFDVPAGQLHAVIGPNGAGKTTLIGQLVGEIVSDSGSIRFGGTDITALPTYRRSQLGLARSFQITSLFPDFTALDNVALAVQAHSGHSFRFWRDARRETELREPARAALERVGLGRRGDVLVSSLSHGEHRQLEIAMALATRPRMLLLDEPMAGMGPEETSRMVATLARAQARADHPADRARHGSGVRARRLHHGPGLRPDHRVRSARTRSGPTRRCGRPISANRKRSMASDPLLELDGVETCYGLSQVLFGMSLKIAAGEMVTLMGRNGMGKTTTVRSIMGLTQARAGAIRFAGHADPRPAVLPGRQARPRAGAGGAPDLSQPERARKPGGDRANRSGAAQPWTLQKICALFPRLEERLGNMGNQLSGGEQQMLAIGRALMTNPQLLILDEATEGLAPLIRAEIWQCLTRLKHDGQSILVIDKNVEALIRIADRHYLIERGRVVWTGTSAAACRRTGDSAPLSRGVEA